MNYGIEQYFRDAVIESRAAHDCWVEAQLFGDRMTESVKKVSVRGPTTNEFKIALIIERWMERLKPGDRDWILVKLNNKYGKHTNFKAPLIAPDTAGPDRTSRPAPELE